LKVRGAIGSAHKKRTPNASFFTVDIEL